MKIGVVLQRVTSNTIDDFGCSLDGTLTSMTHTTWSICLPKSQSRKSLSELIRRSRRSQGARSMISQMISIGPRKAACRL